MNDRIAIVTDMQRKHLQNMLRTLGENSDRLRQYDLNLYTDIQVGFEMSMGDFSMTRRQWNHLHTVVVDLETGRY